MAGAADQPIPRWDERPRSTLRWYVPVLGLLILTIFCGATLGIADGIDDHVSDGVIAHSARDMGTVTAIEVRDDFFRPSVVEVRLDNAVDGSSAISVATTDEEDFHVGERVLVEVDRRDRGLSAIAGDEEGPTWTLGVESIALVATALLLLAAVITAVVLGRRTRREARPRHPWPPVPSQPGSSSPLPPGPTWSSALADRSSPPQLSGSDPVLRREVTTWCRSALVGSALRLIAAAGGLALFFWADSVRVGVARWLWHVIGFLLFGGAGPVALRAIAGRRTMQGWLDRPGPWVPATARLVRGGAQPALLIATDPEHVHAYRYGLDPVRPMSWPAAHDGFPVWISAASRGALAVSDGAGHGLVAAWPARGNPRWLPLGARSRKRPFRRRA